MKEQKKTPQDQQQTPMAVAAPQETVPTTDATLDKIEKALGKNRVLYGSNDHEFDGIAGKTVASIRKALSVPFNLPQDAIPLVNGQQVEESYKLKQEDTLEFVKNSGSKG